MLWPKGDDGGPEPLAWGVGTSKMAMTGRAETHHGGPVRAGMVTMAVPRQEAVRAQLLDEAIDHLLRGEEPALEVNDELSALVEVARLRSLARRAGARSLAVEGGTLVMRMAEGRRLPPSALPQPLPRGVEAGPTSLRLDPVVLGDAWRKLLREVLEGISRAVEANGEKMGK